MLHKLSAKPFRIFLIDGTGAIVTALLLQFLLKRYNEQFGVPENVIPWLALTAFLFSLYSFSCYFLVRKKWQSFLKMIAVANIGYCVATCIIIVNYFQELTMPGLAYFSIEILIIAGLAWVELKLAL